MGQKAVFGLGYPSIPAMTVEELMDQRMKDGWYDQKAGATGQSRSLADEAKNTELANLKMNKKRWKKKRKLRLTKKKNLLVPANKMTGKTITEEDGVTGIIWANILPKTEYMNYNP